MPRDESESKPSRRVARRAARKKQPMNVRLGVFLSQKDADILDEEAEFNELSVSAYLRRLISRGRRELMAEAAEAETLRVQPKDALAAARAKSEEDRRLTGWRDSAQSRAIRRGTIHGRTT